MKKIILVVILVLINGCGSNDPSLESGVTRGAGGIYKSQTVGYSSGMDDAVKQCIKDGDKEVHIITTVQEYSYVMRKSYATFYFKCK